MIREPILLITLLLLFTSVILAQQTKAPCENEYSEPSIGVTYCLPSEWLIIKRDNEPFKIAYGKKSNGAYPTIVIRVESFKGKFSDYVKSGIDYFQTKAKKDFGAISVEIESKGEFTAGKLRGYKLVINTVDKNGFEFRTIQYAFSGKSDTKMVITATAAQADKTESDKTFDEIISSLKFEK